MLIMNIRQVLLSLNVIVLKHNLAAIRCCKTKLRVKQLSGDARRS